MKKTTEKRLEEIKKIVLTKKEVKTNYLAKETGVSNEMIRKDLDYLEKEGFIIRIHGGAKLLEENKENNYIKRLVENKHVKDEICCKAIDYINDGDVVFIDASTTAHQLGFLLKMKKDITIVTNCLELTKAALDSGHKIILLGGQLYTPERRTFGLFAQLSLKKMHFDVAIFGSDGVKGSLGPGTDNDSEVIINEMVIDRANKKILLIDSSKFNTYAKYTYANFNDFDVLITDKFPKDYEEIINIKNIIETDKD